MTNDARARFDPTVLDRFKVAKEIDIETAPHSGGPRLTTVWVLTDGNDVYVRSERGTEGHWYRELTAAGHGAVHIGSDRYPVRAIHAVDAESVELVNDLFRTKYGSAKASTQAMLQPKTLETTLRLEPA